MKQNKRQNTEQLTCAYCGAVKEEIVFCIGASSGPDWCMMAGTGKVTCPACYEKAMAEERAAIERHIKWVQEASK